MGSLAFLTQTFSFCGGMYKLQKLSNRGRANNSRYCTCLHGAALYATYSKLLFPYGSWHKRAFYAFSEIACFVPLFGNPHGNTAKMRVKS
jgi:hypothetical protein